VIILDTDHINILQNERSKDHVMLVNRMVASSDQTFATTAITVEEQMRGWLALIRRTNDAKRQVSAYERLNGVIDYFSRWSRLPFDIAAADRFEGLRRQKIRIGTMDLKIAAIALVHDALLLSANLRDFEQVPGLRVEDWLH
jgi:tRNA(fMet)-specific endonuclease VapC